MTIGIDVETTDLLKPDAVDYDQQPHMTEIGLVKFDDESGEIVDQFETLISVPVPVPKHITKITGIDDQMLENKPKFLEIREQIIDMFLGERRVVGHNVTFDLGVLYIELARHGLEMKFPWPPDWYCTVEKSHYLKGRRLKLSDLHEIATGSPHKEGAHRALADTHAMIRCYRWLCENR